MDQPTIIVTGASSGLGLEFVKLIDRRKLGGKTGIDEIWLVARRKEKLVSLSEKLLHKFRIFALDLVGSESISVITAAVQEQGAVVRFLVNCAGFGKFGSYENIGTQTDINMISVNSAAPVALTNSLIPFMKNGSHIINICSTAAFQPLPFMAVYAASKSLLYSYSRALRVELLRRGISVTAVCPYWMLDTEFTSVAEKEGEQKITGMHHYLFSSHAHSVARRALRGAVMNLAVVTPDPFSFIHRILSKVIPDELLMWGWELLRHI